LIQDIRRHRSDRPGNQNTPARSFCSGDFYGVDRVYCSRASSTTVEDNSLVMLRDSLLSLAKKYPAHARSISQLASSIDLLMYLIEARCLES
jgi:hypothetical protein